MKTMSPDFIRLRRSVLGVVLLLLATGCGSKGRVSGKVFYKDQPLSGGTVQFSHPQLGIVRSQIGPDGSYEIANLPPAEVKIGVTGPPTVKERDLPKDVDKEKLMEKTRGGQPPGPNDEVIKGKMGLRPAPSSAGATGSLPKKYSDPLESGLTYTVISGSQTYDIKLD